MSDDAQRSDGLVGAPGNGKPKQRDPNVVEIRIRFNRVTGDLALSPDTPIQERMLCYGMLEMARDMIARAHLPEDMAVVQEALARSQPAIVVAPEGAVPPFPRRT